MLCGYDRCHEVAKFGDGRVAMIGFPSVGKSSLLTKLAPDVKSECASYEFTTLTCIPGIIYYRDAKIQLLDLPGIIEGASEGRGRGRQVIATAKSADLILIVLDATKDDTQKEKLEIELEAVGIRLNKQPPNISFIIKKGGGVSYNSVVPNTHGVDARLVQMILHEYRIFNADVVFREDVPIDSFIDVIEGNRKYVKCLYVYNKIDMLSIEEIDAMARKPYSVCISCDRQFNLDGLLDRIWSDLDMVRIYTKKRGAFPDFGDPVVLTPQRGKINVETAVRMIHRDLVKDMKHALVWGSSVKHSPMIASLSHMLEDEDVVQIVKKL